MTPERLATHLDTRCYGEFHLTDAIRPGTSIPIRPREGYRIEVFRDRSLKLKRFWHQILGKTFLRGAARIVATSEIEQKEILQAGFPTTQVLVRYNGIDSRRRNRSPDSLMEPGGVGS